MPLDLVSVEKEILAFWQTENCFQQLVEKNRDKPAWSFLDGPITANNPMGVHHAWGRTYKDIFQRYRAMTGHALRYQNGFDCQGLWVEVEVEKELGFKSKRDIETYGIAPFVEKCKERVRKYAQLQTEQSIRLGYWMDWNNSYYTMSDENNYTIWQFLKKCYERGYVYHGWDAMPWCPRCGTGISQHEISNEERPEVIHTSPTVKFPLVDHDRDYLLVWTTTPWTLTANVACAVHPDLTYLKVRQGEETYYLTKDRLEAVTSALGPVEIVTELSGSQMVDWTYRGPFDELPAQAGVVHRVVLWKDVSAADGTGIVHIAPGCGKEDYDLGRESGLTPIAPIDEFGVFVEGFGPFTGQQAGEVTKGIVRSLKEKGLLYRTEEYKHAYPICWRCKTQLLFRLVDEWYISMNELRHEIIEVTKNTRWIPAVGQQLEIEWLTNMHDWMISKKRYWGLALPIYHCHSCGDFEVLGSREELEQRAVAGWDEFDGHSPHRPWIDAVKIACSRCGAIADRIKDVGNPWLDAGIVPYSTMRYNSDREYWNRWFPADWISESFPGQFRNWFYAILAMSTVMENREPFKVMFGYRLMKDEHGEEMHKSKGNAIEFNEAAEREGADAMRWLFASHNPDTDLRFGYGKINEGRRQFSPLWNVFEFFVTHSRVYRFDPATEQVAFSERSELDRWILCRLQTLIESARLNYERYSVHVLMKDVNSFIDRLSRWYLRRSRPRFSNDEDRDKLSAYQTLWHCLLTFAKIVAPIIPFASEAMYRQLVAGLKDAPTSVHLCDFPQTDQSMHDSRLLSGMEAVIKLTSLGHAARTNANIIVRQPLTEMRVVIPNASYSNEIEPFLPLIKDELNVKEITFVDSARELYTTAVKLDAKIGKPKHGRLFNALQESLTNMDAEEVAALVAAGRSLTLRIADQEIEILPAEFSIQKNAIASWSLAEADGLLVFMNTFLTDDLISEGMVRGLIRLIQNLRKEAALEISDRINISYVASQRVAAAIAAHEQYLCDETLAATISRVAKSLSDPLKLGDEVIQLEISKASTS